MNTTHTVAIAKDQRSLQSLGSKDRVETDKQTELIALPPSLTRSRIYCCSDCTLLQTGDDVRGCGGGDCRGRGAVECACDVREGRSTDQCR